MKLFLASVLFVAVAADRLENTYLPPSSAQTAGGNGNFLSAPSNSFHKSSSNIPSGQYGAPTKHQSAEAGASILRFNNENQGDGSYGFEFETENKISQQETGELKQDGSQSVHGSYSYQGDDGKTYTVTYVADENGFRPTGDHLPTPPPIPEAILKSLAQNAAQGYDGNAQAYNGNSQSFNGQSQGFSSHQGNQLQAKPSFNQQSGYQY
ncbi:PREDICTED: pupal cuticle protein 20-like [Nicrophorus vespilloides]|uniref:Pupal cuticle protein 20-like n=1 Tax=Nicrophorus vespilloides TaxID=110193 RepID=A0ABM1M8G1_NICVS|nr:PREDICTED: pupal cuticle protein 20-like [Nicrophorus vespilloides]